MSRFVLLSIFFLGWAFYEVSGGSDFTHELQAEKQAALELEEERKLAAARAEAAEKVALAEARIAEEAARKAVLSAAMVTRAAFDPTSMAVSTAKPQTPANDAKETAAETPELDIRAVRGTRVNVRNGPSTRYNVILKLTRGTRVEILQDPGNGWVKLKVEDTGRIGWMAARLLDKTTG